MARGKKVTPATTYAIMLSMFRTFNYSDTAKQLKLPVSTVRDVYNRHKDEEEFAKLRQEKSEDFVEQATRIIGKAMNRLEATIENPESVIPVNNLTTAIGTLYDKRALAKGQSTVNVHNTYEDMLKEVADDDEY
jgi:hypothetical protein